MRRSEHGRVRAGARARAVKEPVVLVATFFACLGTGGALAAGDADDVTITEIVTKVCAKCHGADGNRMMTPETPKIGGQKADYLANALRDYKIGARTHAIMAAVAQALDADAMEALAQYFAEQESELHTPN
jgi:cytochrome c553